MITYFKDENDRSKKKYKNYETITTILKSFDTFVIITTTSSCSITLSLTGIGLRSIPISTASSCALSIGDKVLYEVVIIKHDKNKKQNENLFQTIKSFDKLYGKSLQYNMIDKIEYQSLCIIFTRYIDEAKKESFL